MQQAECSSFVNEIRKAKDNLNPVRTVVVREDGSFSHEKRSLSGCFERDTGEEDCDEKDSDGQKYDVTVTQMKRMKSLSNRQLKSRLHRQRLGYIVDLEPDLQLAQITCNIFLGSQDVAHDFQILSSAGITHILNCAIGVRNIFEGKIRYMNCDMFDLPSFKITERFPLCFSFIRECVESGGKILVHCNAGVSRSATIVIAYLMKFEKYSLADAINHVNSIRRGRFLPPLLFYTVIECLVSHDTTREHPTAVFRWLPADISRQGLLHCRFLQSHLSSCSQCKFLTQWLRLFLFLGPDVP